MGRTNVKIGCTSFSFDRDITEGEMSLRDFYEFCRSAGIEGVELWDLHLPQQPDRSFVNELRRDLRDFGLSLATIAVNNHEFTSRDAEERAHDIARVKRWIEIVADLDCPVLRVLPGDLKVLNTYRTERYPLVRASFEQCLEHARAQSVTLAVENCPREARSETVVELIEDLNTPFFRTCPDIGNLPQARRYQAWQELVPYAAHAHAKSFHFDDQGEETTLDYSRMMSILRASGFHGYLSVEFEGDGDEAIGVQKSLALIRRYIDN
jgi:sugar phosphate isomerase/epimerase